MSAPGQGTDNSGLQQTSAGIDWLIAIAAVAWALMQWWWASPASYSLGNYIPLLDIDEQKFLHLFFGITVSALVAGRVLIGRPHPAKTALLALTAVAISSPCWYLLAQSEALAERAGDPTTTDIAFGVAGLGVLLLFTGLSLSRGLMVLAMLAIAYLMWGNQAFLPDAMQWKGASLDKTITHLWLYTEGVFGISIGVATQFIFLFVLFGEIMQRMGFGQLITRLSLLLLSRQRAGGAKAAILSSTAIGSISGSSTANVVTTGNFTIPLMMRGGLSREQAGAVEVAASSNGQLMPPIMGAAAFLIAEYTGTPYNDLIYHALLPAVCAFFGLMCVVHLQACAREGLALPKPEEASSLRARLRQWHEGRGWWRVGTRLGGFVLAVALAYSFRQAVPAAVFFAVAGVALIAIHIYWQRCNIRDGIDAENAQTLAEVWRAGAHCSLPLLALLWLLIVEGLSPQLSVWWSVCIALLILASLEALRTWLRQRRFSSVIDFYRGSRPIDALLQLSVTTARRMLPITLATACAGIIVGAITLSGLQQILGDIVLNAAGDSLALLLVFLALASLVLGLGLPTTPNYILISSLFATVLLSATEHYGLSVSLVAIHLFILYFGVLADDTPPVGLCSYAASAISGGNPIQTGIRAFALDTRTAILPFAFIFNPDLLLLDLGPWEAIMVTLVSLLAMYLFSSVLQSWLLVRNRWPESLLLLLASLILLCPQWLHSQLFPPWRDQPVSILLEKAPASGAQKFRIELRDADDEERRLLSFNSQPGLPLSETMLQATGLMIDDDGVVEEVDLFSAADDVEIAPGWSVAILEAERARDISPRWLWLLALALAGIAVSSQWRRRNLELARLAENQPVAAATRHP